MLSALAVCASLASLVLFSANLRAQGLPQQSQVSSSRLERAIADRLIEVERLSTRLAAEASRSGQPGIPLDGPAPAARMGGQASGIQIQDSLRRTQVVHDALGQALADIRRGNFSPNMIIARPLPEEARLLSPHNSGRAGPPTVGSFVVGSSGVATISHAAVARISIRDGGQITCSGTLIHPKIILTAQHCTRSVANNAELRPSAFQVLIQHAGIFSVSRVIRREPYRELYTDTFQSNNDLALLILDRDVFSVPLPPLHAAMNSAGASDLVVVGFGLRFPPTGPDDVSKGWSAGIKVQGTVRPESCPSTIAGRRVTNLNDTNFLCWVASGADELSVTSCGGDSGGPVFVATSSGFALVAVVSGGRRRASSPRAWLCHPGAIAINTRLAPHLDWIRAEIEKMPQLSALTSEPIPQIPPSAEYIALPGPNAAPPLRPGRWVGIWRPAAPNSQLFLLVNAARGTPEFSAAPNPRIVASQDGVAQSCPTNSFDPSAVACTWRFGSDSLVTITVDGLPRQELQIVAQQIQ